MGFVSTLLKAGIAGIKATPRIGMAGLTNATALASLVTRYPGETIGILGGTAGAGAYLAYSNKGPYSSPSLSNNAQLIASSLDNEMTAMESLDTGIAPTGSLAPGIMIRNQRLMESTQGLTQALHRNRHGS